MSITLTISFKGMQGIFRYVNNFIHSELASSKDDSRFKIKDDLYSEESNYNFGPIHNCDDDEIFTDLTKLKVHKQTNSVGTSLFFTIYSIYSKNIVLTN